MFQLVSFTIFVSAMATFVAVVIAVLCGFYVMSKNKVFASYFLMASQALNATPPTVVGVFVYFICASYEPLQGLLFTPLGMIIGQVILGFPIAYYLFSQLLAQSLMKFQDIAVHTVQGEQHFRLWVLIKVVIADIRPSIVATAFIIFGRLVGEVGAILIIGGGIYGKTETLSTNILLQTQQGYIETALLSGVVLLSIVIISRIVVFIFERRTKG